MVQISITNPSDPILSKSNLALATSSPTLDTPVTMVGYGRNRATDLTTYYVTATADPAHPDEYIYTWSTTDSPGASTAYGYQYASGNSKRWGSNTSEGTVTDSGTTYLATSFDPVSGEGQAAVGDSGGGVFAYNATTGKYELAGIMDLVTGYKDQPGGTALFGNDTYSIDIATYRSLILSTVPEPSTIALLLGSGLVLLQRLATRKRRQFTA